MIMLVLVLIALGGWNIRLSDRVEQIERRLGALERTRP